MFDSFDEVGIAFLNRTLIVLASGCTRLREVHFYNDLTSQTILFSHVCIIFSSFLLKQMLNYHFAASHSQPFSYAIQTFD